MENFNFLNNWTQRWGKTRCFRLFSLDNESWGDNRHYWKCPRCPCFL